MSIYFQYPSIDEYQKLIYPPKTEYQKGQINLVEDRIIQQHVEELKDFLALKPV